MARNAFQKPEIKPFISQELGGELIFKGGEDDRMVKIRRNSPQDTVTLTIKATGAREVHLTMEPPKSLPTPKPFINECHKTAKQLQQTILRTGTEAFSFSCGGFQPGATIVIQAAGVLVPHEKSKFGNSYFAVGTHPTPIDTIGHNILLYGYSGSQSWAVHTTHDTWVWDVVSPTQAGQELVVPPDGNVPFKMNLAICNLYPTTQCSLDIPEDFGVTIRTKNVTKN